MGISFQPMTKDDEPTVAEKIFNTFRDGFNELDYKARRELIQNMIVFALKDELAKQTLDDRKKASDWYAGAAAEFAGDTLYMGAHVSARIETCECADCTEKWGPIKEAAE